MASERGHEPMLKRFLVGVTLVLLVVVSTGVQASGRNRSTNPWP
jgi:hypothetical protein